MAISGVGFSSTFHFPLRAPLFHCLRNVRMSSVAVAEATDETEPVIIKHSKINSSRGRVEEENSKAPDWKRFSSQVLGISTLMIAKPTRKVLNQLKKKGYEVYLVGGCVRDLILKRTPKDFDIITSAELKEIVRTFSWCEIVGRRFPICHVHIDNSIVEVSSFSTNLQIFDTQLSLNDGKCIDFDAKDYIRWRNCLQRDFTINGLMFDPYSGVVYDYIGGMNDIKKAKMRTVKPASTSFQEDCARILRGIRIAARLGFRFSRDTSHFIKNLSSSVLRLDKGRLLMEMNYMLAYGSAEASLRLLWQFGLLEILLPIQAAYFVHHGLRRHDKRSNMLLSLFSNMDKLLAPNRPCHSSLWVAILAFHSALTEQPRDPLVLAAFGLAVHNGGDISEAIRIARWITKAHDVSFHELLEPQNLDALSLTNEVTDFAESVRAALSKMTDEHYVSQAMAAYPKAPSSDLVFVPLVTYLRVNRIFECVRVSGEKKFTSKQGMKIDYESLARGSLQEVRHVFARIVFDTLYPLNLNQTQSHT